MDLGRVRPAVPFVALLALALVAGACSSDSGSDESGSDGSGTTETDAGSGDLVPGSAAITIVDLTFEPTTITVASGSTTVVITNADSVDHTFTLDDDSVDAAVAAGQNVTVTIEPSASVGFHCEIHPSMTGTLQVA
jgi:plastocyanin